MNYIELPSEMQLHLSTMNRLGIWTGGAKAGTMTAINATSILGSLRYWTEALMRADGKELDAINEQI